MSDPPNDAGDRPSLLLVDDDEALRGALAGDNSPEYAVVDLKLPDVSGLKLVSALIALDPNTRVVVLTGYGSIATAVETIKLGATYYLAKPVNADEVVRALHRDAGDDEVAPNSRPMSVDRLEWEHIDRVLLEHAGNISATARALSMHRRTLQRKLAKRAVRS